MLCCYFKELCGGLEANNKQKDKQQQWISSNWLRQKEKGQKVAG